MKRQSLICELFNIRYPIIQAGMVWVSGAKLAAASANAGVLGVIGAGSMSPEVLEQQLKKARQLTQKPLAVNLPLLYHRIEEQIDIALKAGIRIFITSAGSPKKYTSFLKDKGCIVAHVTSTPELARKCEQAGVDVVIAEGFEAGGHNGRDELTTLTLIPQVLEAVNIPVVAAGGIGHGRAIAAMFCLGAHGVQMGTRFAATKESSAHDNFKRAIVEANATSTMLVMKDLVPVRLIKNEFFEKIYNLEKTCAPVEKIKEVLGKGRARLGIHEGDLKEGELEIGQIAGLVHDIPSVAELVSRLIKEYEEAVCEVPKTL